MTGDEFPGSKGWSLPARPCDSCKSTAALLYCRADSAFLCLSCDEKIHGANKLASRHERVSICEVCEQAPASVTCKADAAALCVSCDADIHSANPLARRHERFPVVPFYETAAAVKSATTSLLVPDGLLKSVDDVKQEDDADDDDDDDDDEEEADASAETEAEAASWLLPNPKICSQPNPKICSQEVRTCSFAGEVKTGDYFFAEVDPYLELDYGSSIDQRFHQQNGTDCVVPVQNKVAAVSVLSSDHCLDMDFTRVNAAYSYSYSRSHSISSSSMDVGVVPDGSAMADISNPFDSSVKTGIDMEAVVAPQRPAVFNPQDREARVHRYREKRKNRKFEKTIRYASRKAYAETRPRIKGRFAKRTEIEVEVDRIYSSAAALLAETGYGVVPTF